jgi:Fe-S cluster assembly protein SufD
VSRSANALDAFRRTWEARHLDLPGAPASRSEAFERFLAAGLPTTRDEDWRFTNLRELAETDWAPAEPAPLPELPEPLGPRLVFVNGHCVAEPETGELPAGVRLRSLAAALAEDASLDSAVGTLADAKARSLTALNRALWEDGALVEIDDGVSLDQPLEILRVHSAGSAATASHPRTLLTVGAGSRAVLIEQALGSGPGRYLVNSVAEVSLARDARLEHVVFQHEGPDAMALGAIALQQESGSHYTSHSLALGARLARLEIRANLAGEGSHCSLRGLYLGRDRQLLDHHTTIDHATPHTTSDELYKGILDERAHGIFHGRVHVRPHAQKISAEQTNRNLLLSDSALVHTKPQLEIFADDVRCSHGATIGQLDPDQLFYLRARGIGERDARALLSFAFASEIVRTLPTAALRERLEALVLDWLPGDAD